ncbi:conjugal transfer protein TraF [uncultured Helicobacter sp.]|uniref:conjugal transfer protein TraF n=1 Tax=uncultured Helicobacter sp. TaxID=175537 RepID=UPI001C3B73E2|nr:conjugal transfer protein TraF [Candidatus Helicobacter avicola]
MKLRSFGFCSLVSMALLGSTSLSALEFNEVGNKALGMGGVGVALKNNPFGLFFNPSLLGAKPGVKLGYSLGGAISHKNMFEILDYNLSSVSDINAFNNLLEDNNLSAKLQGALVLQLPEFSFGNFAIGYMQSLYASTSFGGFLPTSQSNLDNANLTFDVRGLGITEIPLGYAYSFQTPIGDISAGLAIKLMSASFVHSSVKFGASFDSGQIENAIQDVLKMGDNKRNTFGVDLGITYAPIKNLTIGLVGKNLNTPTFSFADSQIKVRPQARLGIGYEIGQYITIAADADLTNNDVWSLTNTKLQSQKMGVGIDVDFTFFDVRAGVAKDLRQDNGAILSAGLGFGFIDVGFAFSTQKGQLDGKTLPQYIALQIGGGFIF